MLPAALFGEFSRAQADNTVHFSVDVTRSIMNDEVTTVIAIIAIFVGLPVALLVARDWCARSSRKEVEAFSRRFAQRLHNPNLAAIEKYFGHPLPPAIHALYANQDELMREDFEVAASERAGGDERWYVANYQPADEQSVRDTWPGWSEYFAFADDGCGNGYLVDPKQTDPPVFFHDHETGEMLRVCDRLSEFMKWPRLKERQSANTCAGGTTVDRDNVQ